jgi:hypothetical protein
MSTSNKAIRNGLHLRPKINCGFMQKRSGSRLAKWSEVNLEKLVIAQLTRGCLPFMESKTSIPCPKDIIIGPIFSQLNPVHTFTTYLFQFISTTSRSPS